MDFVPELQNLRRDIKAGEQVVVGFSGGADSVMLAELLRTLRDELDFSPTLVHVNHLLRGEESDGDEAFCLRYAADHDFQMITRRVDVGALAEERKISPETAGRQARYAVFREVMETLGATKLVLAHNLDDQVETFLFRLIRGTSLEGLEGIPESGEILRPLAWRWKRDICAWLREHGLSWREDRSNNDPGYTRNRIRLELIPGIERTYNPRFKEKIAALLPEIRAINRMTAVDAEAYFAEPDNNRALSLSALKELALREPLRLRKILRDWLLRIPAPLGRNGLDRSKLEALARIVTAGGAKEITLGGGYSVRKTKDRLTLCGPKTKNEEENTPPKAFSE